MPVPAMRMFHSEPSSVSMIEIWAVGIKARLGSKRSIKGCSIYLFHILQLDGT